MTDSGLHFTAVDETVRAPDVQPVYCGLNGEVSDYLDGQLPGR